jgi:hypothetical protein
MAAIALVACLTLKPAGVDAQTDSAWLDGGTLRLPTRLTQQISIKGEDLEKMPFTDLAQAINVWLYGAYTISADLRFVVDGIPLADVNGYSVYDIERVTLVQDALAQSNGVYRNQQLVLIRTRHRRGTGLTLAAEGGLVNRNTGEGVSGKFFPSETHGYQHEYAGFHHEVGNVRFGVSADYFQDVFPSIKADSIHTGTPLSLKRGQFNGWLVATLGKHNQVSIQASYAPQRIDSAQRQLQKGFGTAYLQDQSTRQHEHVITPTITWSSEFGKGWTNDLRFGYLSWKGNQDGLRQNADTSSVQNTYIQFTNGQYSVEHVLVNERLAYTFIAGALLITSSMNFYYEHDRLSSLSQTAFAGPGSIGPGPASYITYKGHGHFEELTPALNIAYKQALNVQGGLVAGLAHNYLNAWPNGKPANRNFPFVSVATDLLGWGQRRVRPSVKLFFSYAASPQLLRTDYERSTLTALNNLDNLQVPFISFITSGGLSISPGSLFPSADPLTTRYWQWDAGASFSTADGRWVLDYHFEKQKFFSEVVSPVPGPYGSVGTYPTFMSNLHYMAFRARVIEGRRFCWQTSLSVTTLRVTAPISPMAVVGPAVVGDININKPSWTGGWVNRFTIGAVSLGADLLYHFNEFRSPPPGVYPVPPPSHQNSLLMQRFYVGYRLALTKVRVLDLYLDSRGLFRSGQPDPLDGRRYLGAGAKMNI